MTNLYLTEDEYALLSRLEAAPLHKVRHAWPTGGREYSVDAFMGDLEGLVLAEIELGPDEPLLPPPPLTAADVTHDDRFRAADWPRFRPRTPSCSWRMSPRCWTRRELMKFRHRHRRLLIRRR